MSVLEFLCLYALSLILIRWWEQNDYRWPKFNQQPSGEDFFVSKAMARDIEEIMPGETLNIIVKGRRFVILESEEFDVLIDKAGYTLKRSTTK